MPRLVEGKQSKMTLVKMILTEQPDIKPIAGCALILERYGVEIDPKTFSVYRTKMKIGTTSPRPTKPEKEAGQEGGGEESPEPKPLKRKNTAKKIGRIKSTIQAMPSLKETLQAVAAIKGCVSNDTMPAVQAVLGWVDKMGIVYVREILDHCEQESGAGQETSPRYDDATYDTVKRNNFGDSSNEAENGEPVEQTTF